MIAADLRTGEFAGKRPIKGTLAARQPYAAWLGAQCQTPAARLARERSTARAGR